MNLARTPRLEDCAVHGPGSGAELFVVEGDSAASAVAAARDARHQAVLPMQGKPMNATRAPAAKVAAYPLFARLVAALDAGFDVDFAPERRRYERIVLLFDPDADGIHAGALMLLFFHRWMRPLLASGHVIAVRPPLGEVRHGDATGASQRTLAYDEGRFRALCAAHAGAPGYLALRYRGLGSIGPAELATHCIAPATRNAAPLGERDAALALQLLGPRGS
jgi:DNA gyrase subunit B/topoisomerase-4 subunit B